MGEAIMGGHGGGGQRIPSDAEISLEIRNGSVAQKLVESTTTDSATFDSASVTMTSATTFQIGVSVSYGSNRQSNRWIDVDIITGKGEADNGMTVFDSVTETESGFDVRFHWTYWLGTARYLLKLNFDKYTVAKFRQKGA